MYKYFTSKKFYEPVQFYSSYFIECKTFWGSAMVVCTSLFVPPLSVVVVQNVGSFDLNV